MKFTSSRVSVTGSFIPTPSGRTGALIKPSIGPMCNTVDDMILISKALLGWTNHFEDGAISYKPFNQERLDKFDDVLTIGYAETLPNICNANPAAQRGVREAIEVIRKLGHNVVKLDYDFSKAYSNTIKTITSGEKIRDM